MSSVSQDPSWFDAQERFIIIINVKNSWKLWQTFLLWIESSKEQHLFEKEIIWNTINVIIVTFDKFNASLVNKSTNLIEKIPYFLYNII